jgi:hypothetical protein
VVVSLKRAIAAGGGPSLGDLECSELARAVAQALRGEGPATLVARETLKPRVFRLRFLIDGRERSLVAKRMSPEHARRNQLAIRRWLPDVGLGALVPDLLGVAAAADGSWVWQVYEDLGPWELGRKLGGELDGRLPDPDRVAAVVREVAALHARFASHPVLAECRLHGENRDPSHLGTMVRDAIRALERLRPQHLAPGTAAPGVRNRLLARLYRLHAEAPARARALSEWGGPETLLHGDLWTTNTFAEPVQGGFRVRLIDWDRAGVGKRATTSRPSCCASLPASGTGSSRSTAGRSGTRAGTSRTGAS